MPRAVVNSRYVRAGLARQRRRVIFKKYLGESVYRPDGGPQIVGHRVGESLEILIGGGKLRGALRDSVLECLSEALNFLLGGFALGDILRNHDKVLCHTFLTHQGHCIADPQNRSIAPNIARIQCVACDFASEHRLPASRCCL